MGVRISFKMTQAGKGQFVNAETLYNSSRLWFDEFASFDVDCKGKTCSLVSGDGLPNRPDPEKTLLGSCNLPRYGLPNEPK